jgi:hypothetical protein
VLRRNMALGGRREDRGAIGRTEFDALEGDPVYGGCTVLLGVPTGWPTLDADSVKGPALHRVIGKADVIRPGTVGRYRSLESRTDHARKRWEKDLGWCRARGKDCLPVAFPGFCWHNRHRGAPLDEVPRLRGRFL